MTSPRAEPSRPAYARARAVAIDRRIDAEAVAGRLSLDPARERATTLLELAERSADAGHEPTITDALVRGLAALAEAQLDAFPGNLFWDFDLIAAVMADEATRARSPAAGRALLDDRFARMVELQSLYGRETAINFRYVHDFVYGFDWAKWVAREPELHADPPGPFALRFLRYMRRRGHELLGLIAEDDAKYPALADGRPRNPFPFSREPADEVRLHRELARRDLIPVPAWDADAISRDWSKRWTVPFQTRRIEVARELGA